MVERSRSSRPASRRAALAPEARADRLAWQHGLGAADATEVASTISWAQDRGLLPIVGRLQALTPTTRLIAAHVFRRDDDVWTLVFGGVEARLPDAKGLRDLCTLVANPGVDIPAARLATDVPVTADASPVLDARAKTAYRRRLDDLDRELDRAAVRGDAGGPRPSRRNDRPCSTSPARRRARWPRPPRQQRPGAGAQDRHGPHPGHPAPARRPPPGARCPPAGIGPHRRGVRIRPGRAGDVGPRAVGPQPNQAPSGRRVQCRLDVGHRREQDLIAA